MIQDTTQTRASSGSMTKTGEGDPTDGRELRDQHLVASRPETAPQLDEPEPGLADPPSRAAAPGMSDAAIRRGTGKTWDEWFALLDGWRGMERTHLEIARHLAEEHGLGGWWAQSVTVGYERARGMRAVHQLTDGFSVNASKTFPVPVERLFAAFVEEAARDEWLETGTLRLRTSQANRSARFDVLPNGTRLEVYFAAKGDAKSSAALQHVKLAASDEIETWRPFWKERLNRIATFLAQARDAM